VRGMKGAVKEGNVTKLVLPPFKRSFQGEAPDGWVRYAHLDGQDYFSSQSPESTSAWAHQSPETDRPKFYTFTQANMQNDSVRESFLSYRQQILDELVKTDRGMLDQRYIELVIDWLSDITVSNEGQWVYYFADCRNRTIFWLDPHDVTEVANDIGGIQNLNNLKTYIEYEYWLHRSRFCTDSGLSKSDWKEVKCSLIYASIDPGALFCRLPFSPGTLVTQLDTFNYYVKQRPKDDYKEGLILGRIMSQIAAARIFKKTDSQPEPEHHDEEWSCLSSP